jgi:hypothetical protein
MLVFIIKLYYLWTSYMSIMMLWDIHKFFIFFVNFTKVATKKKLLLKNSIFIEKKKKKEKKSMFFHCKVTFAFITSKEFYSLITFLFLSQQFNFQK